MKSPIAPGARPGTEWNIVFVAPDGLGGGEGAADPARQLGMLRDGGLLLLRQCKTTGDRWDQQNRQERERDRSASSRRTEFPMRRTPNSFPPSHPPRFHPVF